MKRIPKRILFLLVAISLFSSCKTESSKEIASTMTSNAAEGEAEFLKQIACMKLYASGKRQFGKKCDYDPIKIVRSSRVLLAEIRDETMAKGRSFMMILRDDFGEIGNSTIRTENLQVIEGLNPNYIVVFRHHIRIELGGGDDHHGYYVYEEGYHHEDDVPAHEIQEGLWYYGRD